MIELRMTPILWFLLIIFSAILDVMIGDPQILIHPVQLIGKLISFLTKILNKGKFRKFKGFIMVLTTLIIVFAVINILESIFSRLGFFFYFLFNLWFLSTSLCERSLFQAGKQVKDDLTKNEIIKAREETALIVGRKTDSLNKSEIIRAVVESEAENSIDGILAPLIFMLFGLFLSVFSNYLNPLVLVYLYKTINTMDSMVGYPFEPYTEFGYCAAKLDDIINFIPARIGSLFILIAGGLAGYNMKEALLIFENDRNNNPSPNAGHPEAAIAGLLQIQLGGKNNYNGHTIEKPKIGYEKYPLSIQDITETMKIIIVSEEILLIFSSLIVFIVYLINFFIISVI